MTHKEVRASVRGPEEHPHARFFNERLTLMAAGYGITPPVVELFSDVAGLIQTGLTRGKLEREWVASEARQRGISEAALINLFSKHPPFMPADAPLPTGMTLAIEDYETNKTRYLVYLNPREGEGPDRTHLHASEAAHAIAEKIRRTLDIVPPRWVSEVADHVESHIALQASGFPVDKHFQDIQASSILWEMAWKPLTGGSGFAHPQNQAEIDHARAGYFAVKFIRAASPEKMRNRLVLLLTNLSERDAELEACAEEVSKMVSSELTPCAERRRSILRLSSVAEAEELERIFSADVLAKDPEVAEILKRRIAVLRKNKP